MGDPFSAAGTAVGIISLGIQVCQGLVSYYDKWKSFDDDIAQIQDKLNGLKQTLENLERNIVPKFRSSNAREIEDVNKKILSCCNGIHKLKAILTQCQSSAPTSNTVHRKAYRLLQKTFYPFKRTTLLELKTSVSSLQENLHTSILSLMLGVTNDQRESLSILSSNSLARDELHEFRREFQSIASDVEVIRDRMVEDQVTSSSKNLISERNLENLPKLQEDIEKLPEILERLLRINFEDHWQKTFELLQTSRLSACQRNMAMQDHAHTMQTRLIQTPYLLRNVSDELGCIRDETSSSLLATEYNVLLSPSPRRNLKRRKCSCRPSDYSLRFPVWNALFSSSALIHEEKCHLFKYPEKENLLNLRFVYCGRILAQAINASIHLKRGAGGFSISPKLNCSRVVPYKGSIFSLFDSELATYLRSAHKVERIDSFIRKLHQEFQRGNASPHDVDENGNTLQHYIILQQIAFSDDSARAILHLIKCLSSLGIPLNEVNAEGMTCLDEVQRWQPSVNGSSVIINVSSSMLDIGAQFVRLREHLGHMQDVCTNPGFVEYVLKVEEVAEVCDFNAICDAVCRRSESDLLNVIRTHRHLINEPGVFGLRPLHLAIGWSSGIITLLNHEAEVNVFDDQNFRPIDHAIWRACLTSVSLLEETNFPTFGLQRALFTGKQAKGTSILDYLISVEVNRRRNLRALVTNHLPQSRILSFLGKDRLLDAHAIDAVSALRQYTISIPASLSFEKSSRTLYHLDSLQRHVAESFWKAGFRDINEPDCFGNTPLMKWNPPFCGNDYLELIDWFEEKGSKIDETVQHIHSRAFFSRNHHLALCPCLISGHTVLHWIANRVNMDVLRWPLWSDRSLEMFQRIIMNEKQDACKCACSLTGCRGISIIFKPWTRNARGFGTFLPRLMIKEWPSKFLLLCLTENTISEEIIHDVIRLLTFDTLGLTHTCCRPKDEDPMDLIPFEDRDEIQEIHDEEQEDLQLLEDLILEFDEYRRKSSCCVRDFFCTYWRSRMIEVLSEEKSFNQDEFREIGVTLHASQREHWTFVDMHDELVNDFTNDLIRKHLQNGLTNKWIKIYRQFEKS